MATILYSTNITDVSATLIVISIERAKQINLHKTCPWIGNPNTWTQKVQVFGDSQHRSILIFKEHSNLVLDILKKTNRLKSVVFDGFDYDKQIEVVPSSPWTTFGVYINYYACEVETKVVIAYSIPREWCSSCKKELNVTDEGFFKCTECGNEFKDCEVCGLLCFVDVEFNNCLGCGNFACSSCWQPQNTDDEWYCKECWVPDYDNIELVDYLADHTPSGWEEFFTEQQNKDYGSLIEISSFLMRRAEDGVKIYPPLNLVFSVFDWVTPEHIKVLIIGQDPYHDEGQAMGISFSVPVGIKVPPSLRNIYTELQDDGFTVKDPSCGDLTPWCQQGVMLLNSALTVEAHQAASHSKKWMETFTPSLMRYLDTTCNDLVIIMWGDHAQSFKKYFGTRHKMLMSPHPSPFSAHKGFYGSKPFSKTNKQLKTWGKTPIDWNL
jgi:uracil-DNA glycosylase